MSFPSPMTQIWRGAATAAPGAAPTTQIWRGHRGQSRQRCRDHQHQIPSSHNRRHLHLLIHPIAIKVGRRGEEERRRGQGDCAVHCLSTAPPLRPRRRHPPRLPSRPRRRRPPRLPSQQPTRSVAPFDLADTVHRASPPSADAVRLATAPTSSTPSATPPLRPRRRRPRRLPSERRRRPPRHCSDHADAVRRATARTAPPPRGFHRLCHCPRYPLSGKYGEKSQRERGRERGTETDSWAPLSDYE
ncbi:Os10g0102800 [Oryza sativa Japonica Group]|uniref:Os10g0102800 protein n=1 Tax=Oryza sativa subsp. japonica TaxID=39947 RepID=C7J7L4_ORYSJ|nr:Os10g0102800 [Oryza sativa Japonica Group]|eukprot:NP_001176001.1 Os10g0102800 [Oryza sativa Japonica Group]